MGGASTKDKESTNDIKNNDKKSDKPNMNSVQKYIQLYINDIIEVNFYLFLVKYISMQYMLINQ